MTMVRVIGSTVVRVIGSDTDFHRFHQNPPSSPLSTTIQTPSTPNALVITARIHTGSTFSIFPS